MEQFQKQNQNAVFFITEEQLLRYGEQVARNVAIQLGRTEEEEIYKPKAFAKKLGVDVSTVWRWVQDGKLKKTIIAGRTFYKLSDLQQ